MDRHEMEDRIRTAVTQATPDQLEDILSLCEGDSRAPLHLPNATRRRPALAAVAALVLVALGLGLFPMGEVGISARRGEGPLHPVTPVVTATVSPSQAPDVSAATQATGTPKPTRPMAPTQPPAPTQPAKPTQPVVSPAPAVSDTPSTPTGVHVWDPQVTPASSRYIDSSTALHAALLSLELEYNELPYHHEEFNWDDSIYEVEICHNGIEYDCKIDAYSGDCLGWEQEACDHPDHQGAHHSGHHTSQPSAIPTQFIGRDAALTQACTHLSLSSADLLDPKAELDQEDDRAIYEVEFCHGGIEYELELDACTGQVLKQDSEPCDEASHGHSQHHTSHHNGHH